jgi:tetrahydromethanopterin S-methyltransferase subunit E
LKKRLRAWFYAETVTGLVTGVMFIVTLLNRAWIETVFNVDPDRGQGWVEWLIVAGLLVLTVACGALARHEWRRASPAMAA